MKLNKAELYSGSCHFGNDRIRILNAPNEGEWITSEGRCIKVHPTRHVLWLYPMKNKPAIAVEIPSP